MAPVIAMADEVRKNGAPAAPDNPFIALQESATRQIVAALDAWRDMRDAMSESLFLTVYGSPLLQAALGIALQRAGECPDCGDQGENRERRHPRSVGARLDLHRHAASCGRRAGVPSDPPPAGSPS
jgi:Protein of unknown function (DUF3141)